MVDVAPSVMGPFRAVVVALVVESVELPVRAIDAVPDSDSREFPAIVATAPFSMAMLAPLANVTNAPLATVRVPFRVAAVIFENALGPVTDRPLPPYTICELGAHVPPASPFTDANSFASKSSTSDGNRSVPLVQVPPARVRTKWAI
jgi:hypothetical protein